MQHCFAIGLRIIHTLFGIRNNRRMFMAAQKQIHAYSALQRGLINIMATLLQIVIQHNQRIRFNMLNYFWHSGKCFGNICQHNAVFAKAHLIDAKRRYHNFFMIDFQQNIRVNPARTASGVYIQQIGAQNMDIGLIKTLGRALQKLKAFQIKAKIVITYC